jgi:hypothetical protein
MTGRLHPAWRGAGAAPVSLALILSLSLTVSLFTARPGLAQDARGSEGAEDAELAAFRRSEEQALARLVTTRSWLKVLDRAGETLVRLPDDPFALGWAGWAIVNLGYPETGAALMRAGAEVIQHPGFQAVLAAPKAWRDTTVVVKATPAPLRADEAAPLQAALGEWATAFLRNPEPLSPEIPAPTLRAVTALLDELRTIGVATTPAVSVAFVEGTVTLIVRGHAPQRALPPLELVKADGAFRRASGNPAWSSPAPSTTEIRLERFADFTVPGVFAEACRTAPDQAVAALRAAPESALLTVGIPAWPGEIVAAYAGCTLTGADGSIRLPFLDWPDGQVALRLGEHEVRLPSPGRPGPVELAAADHEWMRGTLVLRHVPEGFTASATDASLPCQWKENVGTCTVVAGDFDIEVGAPGRLPVRVAGRVSALQESPHELRLERAELLSIDLWDGVALGAAAVGATAIAGGYFAVAATREGLKALPGVLPAGTVQQTRSVEAGATTAVIAGGLALLAGLSAEAWLLGADVLDHDRLPEWE